MNNLPNLDVEFLKSEVDKIYANSKKMSKTSVKEKYSKFNDTFPTLMDNILDNKMSIEEIKVLLDTFGKAQDTYINNVKFK